METHISNSTSTSWRLDAILSRTLRKPRQSKLPELIQLIYGKSETGYKEGLSELPSITQFFLKTGIHSPRGMGLLSPWESGTFCAGSPQTLPLPKAARS